MKTIKQLEDKKEELESDLRLKREEEHKPAHFNYHIKIVEAELQILNDVIKEIGKWEQEECKDKKEKCHECVAELRERFEGKDEKIL